MAVAAAIRAWRCEGRLTASEVVAGIDGINLTETRSKSLSQSVGIGLKFRPGNRVFPLSPAVVQCGRAFVFSGISCGTRPLCRQGRHDRGGCQSSAD